MENSPDLIGRSTRRRIRAASNPLTTASLLRTARLADFPAAIAIIWRVHGRLGHKRLRGARFDLSPGEIIHGLHMREAVGVVVGQIIPWNFPAEYGALKWLGARYRLHHRSETSRAKLLDRSHSRGP